MLNWRPVREIEQRTREIEIAIWREQQRQEQIEQRTKLIEQRTKLIENETEQIRKETEQLRKENARLKELNAKGRALLSCVDQLCFPPDSSSTPALPTASDGKPSSP
jgi:hypothetical protein